MNSRTAISVIVAFVLTAFAALLFYFIFEMSTDKFSGLGIIGLLSLLFAFIGYLLYAFVGVHKSVQGFVWGYYAFGFGSLFYSVVILRYSISLLLGLLLMFAVSLILIQWRIHSVSATSVKGKVT